MQSSRIRCAVAGTLAALLVAACSTTTTGEGELPGSGGSNGSGGSGGSSASGPALHPLWTAKVGGGVGANQLAGGTADATRFYVNDDSGNVFALSAKTGSVLWHVKPGQRTGDGVGLAGSVVTFYDTDAGLSVLDAATGRTLWARKTDDVPSGDSASFANAAGVIAVAGSNGLEGRDARTGHLDWTISDLTYDFDLVSPVSDATTIYGLARGADQGPSSLVAIAPRTGKILWKAVLPSGVGGDAESALVVGGGTVFALGQAGSEAPTTILAFDASTHARRWSATVDLPNTQIADAVVAGPDLVFGTLKGATGISLATGAKVFTSAGDGGGPVSDIGLCANLACGIGLEQLRVWDAKGDVVAEIQKPGGTEPVSAVPVAGPHTYLVGAADVYALS